MKQGMHRCLVNGKEQATISVEDRGLQYGDGLFETINVQQGRCLRLSKHMQRLQTGCRRLGIPLSSEEALQQECKQLAENVDKGIIKIIISRGSGGRGYKVPNSTETTRIVMLYAWPDYPQSNAENGVELHVCNTILACHPQLAGIKHLNRLENILARSEWDSQDIAEGIMCNSRGNVIEGTMSNLFLVNNGVLHTPDLTECGVAGIMREQIMQLAETEDIKTIQKKYKMEDVLAADELFITNSIIGIWPVKKISKHDYRPGPVTMQLMQKLSSATKTTKT